MSDSILFCNHMPLHSLPNFRRRVACWNIATRSTFQSDQHRFQRRPACQQALSWNDAQGETVALAWQA